uniref:H(+)/Cl(-) exchange transporter 7 n=2 Tax=Lygus hesperus TaxID=30085 RepID=A0A0A9VVG9_LYGHE
MKIPSYLYQSVHSDPKFPVRRDINSLNCDYPFPNAERLQKEEKLNLLSYYYTKWTIIILLGVIIGCILLMITFIIEELTFYKTKLFVGYIFPMGEGAAVGIYLVFTICTSLLSALPVLFWHPTVQGVGVPETISYLNGVDVPGLENWTQIPARFLSTLLMILAGLPGGQTEALLPIGLTVASNVALLKIKGRRMFPNHRYDSDRMEFGAVGLGAAASANFGTPLGGVFFVLQQLSSWHAGMTFIIIVGSLMASYLFIAVYNVVRNVDDHYHNANSFFSPFEDEHKPDFLLSEFPTFILMSLIGGVLGPLWVCIHGQLSRLRVRFVKGKLEKLAEIALLSIFISSPLLQLLFTNQQCSKKMWTTNFGKRILDELHLNCSGDKFNAQALMLLGNPETVVRTILILPDGEISLTFTVMAFFFVFVGSALHLGTWTTNGVVVPNLLMGALWGRIFKHLVADYLFGPETAKMAKYSFLGAVAQIAGVTQYSIAFGIMMSESVGVINFALPVFVIIFCTRYVSTLFSSGIYEVIACVKGYSILVDSAPPLCVDLTAKDIMSTRVVALPTSMTAGNVRSVLENYPHLEFPVMDIGEILDTVS